MKGAPVRVVRSDAVQSYAANEGRGFGPYTLKDNRQSSVPEHYLRMFSSEERTALPAVERLARVEAELEAADSETTVLLQEQRNLQQAKACLLYTSPSPRDRG